MLYLAPERNNTHDICSAEQGDKKMKINKEKEATPKKEKKRDEEEDEEEASRCVF